MFRHLLSLPRSHSNFGDKSSLLVKALTYRPGTKVLIFLLGLISSVFGVAVPIFQKEFVDTLLGTPPVLDFALFKTWTPTTFIFAAFIATALSSFFSTLMAFIATRESSAIQKHLGELMYAKALELRPDARQKRTVGESVSIFASDVSGAGILVEQSLPAIAITLFPMILAPLALHTIFSPPLGPTYIAISIAFGINLVLAARQARFFLKFKQFAAERASIVNEWVQNIRALKILSWIDFFESRIFEKRTVETNNRIQMVTNGQIMSSLGSTVTFIVNIVAISSLFLLRPSELTPGALLSILWIVGVFLSKPFRHLPWIITYVLDGVTSIKRLENYLKTENSPPISTASKKWKPDLSVTPAISTINLGLKSSSGVTLLRNMDFTVANGEFVCIVGEVGSGKSLLLLSLIGETGAEFTSYKLFGDNVQNISLNSIRSQFAFVPQESFVMSARLKDNVALDFDISTPSDGEIAKSLSLSQFDIMTEGLPTGANTEIGERGVNLSGGQRQRLNIARAHYFDRPIILMDDCLSAVDVNVEKEIISSMFLGAWKNKTRILVTHRLSVLSKADRIYFLEEGKISATGTMRDLVKNSENFRIFIRATLDKEGTKVPAHPEGTVHG